MYGLYVEQFRGYLVLDETKRTFDEAVANCKDEGGQLVTVRNQEDGTEVENFIVQSLSEKGIGRGTPMMCIPKYYHHYKTDQVDW